jgi:pilus assembly protein FimV
MQTRTLSLSSAWLGAVVLALALSSAAAQAVTLGQARVFSYLNQPLNAEIPLIGLDPGQEQSLRLRIADQRFFDSLGIAYTQAVSNLEFALVESGNGWVVKLTTQRPLTEPFLDFPLQMAWPGGQMIKQYTLLLDPPRMAPAVRAASVAQPTAPAPRQTVREQAPTAQSYGPVARGETLWPIANSLRPAGITTQQMAMALLRANPQAFIDGNVNRLRAGATLQVPTRAVIEQMDAATARRAFGEQVRQWQAPVSTSPRRIEQAVRPAPEPAPAAPAPTSREAAAAEEAQLRIVAEQPRAEPETGSTEDLQQQLLVTMEEIESNRLTTGAIETRLAKLEAELVRVQQLVELKDAQIAALQSELGESESLTLQTAGPGAGTAPAPVSNRPAPADTVKQVVATAAAPPVPDNTVVAAVETLPEAARPTAKPLYEQYAWLAWVLAALAGLSVLILLFRRQEHEQDLNAIPVTAGAARLPAASAAAGTDELPPAEVERAADELRRQESLDEPDDTIDLPPPSRPRPRRGEPPAAANEPEPEPDLDIASIMDELAEGRTPGTTSPRAEDRPLAEPSTSTRGPATTTPDFSDDDIAAWVAELGNEAERVKATDTRQGNDSGPTVGQTLTLDDDLPSILTELDDQLNSVQQADREPGAGTRIKLEPIDDLDQIETVAPEDDLDLDQPLDREQLEDDTFTMSLDLARAYLEIGDKDGARDMLEQALSVAQDTEQRSKLEALMKQIG